MRLLELRASCWAARPTRAPGDDILEISKATADRERTLAKAWLFGEPHRESR
jgi:hypothetical protein